MVEYQELRFKVGLSWKGDYSSSTEYKKADVVVTDAGAFVSKKGGNVGHDLTDTEWWSVLIDATRVKNATDTAETLNTAMEEYVAVATVAEAERVSNESARVVNEAERVANETERVLKESNRVSEHAARMESATNATNAAQELAEHPMYVGDDFYVYTYDVATHAYNKSNVFVKGEGFSISGTFPSISTMNASRDTVDGCFYMVVSNVDDEDNGKLYVKTNGQMKFIVDLSGVRGFTGKTPQISIGSVIAGSGIYSAGASLSPNGVDANGNPAYLLSLTLPRLTYNNLTSSQIAELQQPATEVAAELRRRADAGEFNGPAGPAGITEVGKGYDFDPESASESKELYLSFTKGSGDVQKVFIPDASRKEVMPGAVKYSKGLMTDDMVRMLYDADEKIGQLGSGNGSVNAETTDEIAASVEESIMSQYGTSIAQLGLELSEIKARIAALEGK